MILRAFSLTVFICLSSSYQILASVNSDNRFIYLFFLLFLFHTLHGPILTSTSYSSSYTYSQANTYDFKYICFQT